MYMKMNLIKMTLFTMVTLLSFSAQAQIKTTKLKIGVSFTDVKGNSKKMASTRVTVEHNPNFNILNPITALEMFTGHNSGLIECSAFLTGGILGFFNEEVEKDCYNHLGSIILKKDTLEKILLQSKESSVFKRDKFREKIIAFFDEGTVRNNADYSYKVIAKVKEFLGNTVANSLHLFPILIDKPTVIEVISPSGSEKFTLTFQARCIKGC